MLRRSAGSVIPGNIPAPPGMPRPVIGLYQFHRPDPKVPYAESIGALKELLDASPRRDWPAWTNHGHDCGRWHTDHILRWSLAH